MKQIELSENELYYLARHMISLWTWEENRYAKSIFDKVKVLLDEATTEINTGEFAREYKCEWGSSKIEGTVPIESPSNDKYHKKCEDNYMNELLKKYGRNK